ncbi:MAG: Gfo/Idh/MocA family oxidoreductase [Anaeromicrobium sp.]|jgi:predicted dehydrogenase|uniref:Gfo/Idh/MocA family protein n=1 Tax=Anaeromicrobium sp. TaxID=1929132 RepID=UPI0025FD1F0C|nr:Gfo/Idh/MocA family oxidoreductase [Anaeromicrobium sp.]MCT4593966.1 Gfo/Idh/MocA family oxidoreductase [Anaeromicrobium sp.]
MKICFVGIGSIGKRHLKNLTSISKEFDFKLEIHAFRNSDRELESEVKVLIDKQIFEKKDLHDNYDVVFITNPTSLHYTSIDLLATKTKHMFIEKPIFEDITYDIDSLTLRNNGIYYVAAPLRYTEVIQHLKELLKEEKIYSVRTICSSYLPDWRLGVDYRKVYSAKKGQGGGVSIDLIHEWDYLTYLFGFPQKVFNLYGQFSHLEIDSEDLSIYIAKYRDRLIELHLDYFGRIPKREIEIYTETGTITGNLIDNEILFTDGREKIKFHGDRNEMYIKEMRNFLDCILNNKENENNIYHAYKMLKLAKGII